MNVDSALGSTSAGGLVNWNWAGTIENSYAEGDVKASTTSSSTDQANAGGLTSSNEGIIRNSYAAGNVEADAPTGSDGIHIGGLSGENEEGAIIQNSYASGDVTANGIYVAAGGLVGNNEGGSIINSYSAPGNISVTTTTSNIHIGGVAGRNQSDSLIQGGVAMDKTLSLSGGSSTDIHRIAGSNEGTLTGNKAYSVTGGGGDTISAGRDGETALSGNHTLFESLFSNFSANWKWLTPSDDYPSLIWQQ
ncbi:MAG: hypothetical protein LBT68_06150 [Spirochaetales bacterium]|nr:hypothetical protein [Spirochaetales bacterium]